MPSIFFLCALFLLAAADSNDAGEAQRNDRIESEDPNDAVAYESYGSPVYGPSAAAVAKSGGLPPPGKSAYGGPVPPPLPAIPAAYAGYLNGLGYGNPYAFNRFGALPYAAPYAYGAPYGYGTPYGAGAYGALPYNALGYTGALAAGLGYPAGLPYNPFLGRAAFNVLGYPGSAGLGYRFGGVPSAAFRGLPYPAPLPAAAPAAIPAAVPAAPVPPPPPAVRPPIPTTIGKDGSLRYAYGPLQGPKVPGY